AHEEDFLSGIPHDLIAGPLPVRQEPELARGGGFEAQADVGIAYMRRGFDLGQHPQRACRDPNHHALLLFAVGPAPRAQPWRPTSDPSVSVPCRPSTWTCVSPVTESVFPTRPNQPVETRTVPAVRSTCLTFPSSEPAAGDAG